MRQLLFTALALLGLASSCPAQSPAQGPPDFGIDTSGTYRHLNLRDATLGARVPMGYIDTTTHTWISHLANAVETFGAKGDSNGTTGNGTNDTAAIEACVAGGRICLLRPGATYRLMSAVDIPSNGGLIGMPGPPATLYCDPAGINNTDLSFAARYLETSDCIQVQGSDGTQAGAVTNVVLKDFRINWGGNSGSRCCNVIEARNTKNMTIDGLEIYNGSAYGIRFASWQGGRIVNNYIHDFSNDTGFEYSAIQGDDDNLSGAGSNGVLIADNRLVNITMSEAGYDNAAADASLPDGYQPNGIKIVNGDDLTSTDMVIRGNRISYTGQGIDFYGRHSLITGNTVEYAVVIGIAMKHGASYNVVSGNTVRYFGAGGIGSNGDDGNPNIYNVMANNSIYRGNEVAWPGSPNNSGTPPGFMAGVYAGGETSCMGYAVPGIPDPNPPRSDYEIITGNDCDPGPNGKWAWYPRSGAYSHNYWVNNYGKTGTSGIWGTGGGMTSGGQHSATDISALVPWVDVTSALNVDLDLVTSNLLNMIGGATIGDFTGGQAGQFYFIKFAVALNLRCQGGSLACPTTTNEIRTAPGDSMMLVVDNPSTSGTAPAYRIPFYQRADGTPFVVTKDGQNPLVITYTNDGNVVGPYVTYMRDSASPAANDDLGALYIQGRDTVGDITTYAQFSAQLLNPTDGAEAGGFQFRTTRAGNLETAAFIQSGLMVGTLVNDPGPGGIAFGGDFAPDKTNISGGTTGAQTINKPAGTVNFAASVASLVVTNSLVNTNSIVLCTVQKADTTMKSVACVPAAGSFTIVAGAVPAAETKVGFLVVN